MQEDNTEARYVDSLYKLASYINDGPGMEKQAFGLLKGLVKRPAYMAGAIGRDMITPIMHIGRKIPGIGDANRARVAGFLKDFSKGTSDWYGKALGPGGNSAWSKAVRSGIGSTAKWTGRIGLPLYAAWDTENMHNLANAAGYIPGKIVNWWEDNRVAPAIDELTNITSGMDAGWKMKAIFDPDAAYADLEKKIDATASSRAKSYAKQYVSQLKSQAGRQYALGSLIMPETANKQLREQAQIARKKAADDFRKSWTFANGKVNLAGAPRYKASETTPSTGLISEEAISKYTPWVAGTAAAGLGLWGLSKFMNKNNGSNEYASAGYGQFYPQGY